MTQISRILPAFWWCLWAFVFGVAVLVTVLACMGVGIAGMAALAEENLARKKRARRFVGA